MNLDQWLIKKTGFSTLDWALIAGAVYAGWCLFQ